MKVYNRIFLSLLISMTSSITIFTQQHLSYFDRILTTAQHLHLARNELGCSTQNQVPELFQQINVLLSFIDIDSTDKNKNSLLHKLYKREKSFDSLCSIVERIDESDLSMIMPFIEDGINPNLKNHHGNTPLHILLKYTPYHTFSLNNIKLLQEHGADITTVNNQEETLLHRIMQPWDNKDLLNEKFLTLIQFLAQHISPCCKDINGMTPLHKFMKCVQKVEDPTMIFYFEEIAKSLIIPGVSIYEKDITGATPFDYAAQ